MKACFKWKRYMLETFIVRLCISKIFLLSASIDPLGWGEGRAYISQDNKLGQNTRVQTCHQDLQTTLMPARDRNLLVAVSLFQLLHITAWSDMAMPYGWSNKPTLVFLNSRLSWWELFLSKTHKTAVSLHKNELVDSWKKFTSRSSLPSVSGSHTSAIHMTNLIDAAYNL